MPAYTPPLSDLRFTIRHLADLPAVRQLPPFADVDDDLVDAILEEAGKLAAEVLAPLNVIGDRQGCILENGTVRTPEGFRDAYRLFQEGGWMGVPFAVEAGGQGLPRVIATAVSELWKGANMAFDNCPLLTQSAAALLLRHAAPDVVDRYARPLIEGTWTGTMNLTEAQAGSDLGLIRTRAVPDAAVEGRFRLTGEKIFVTFGEHDLTPNIIHLVLARLPDGAPGTRGLSLFLVPKFLVDADGALGERNAVRCQSLEHKLGLHGSPTAVLTYGDGEAQHGAIGYLIGERHRGLDAMFTMMNTARLGVGLQGVGVAEAAYQLARAYAAERPQGRVPGNPAPGPVPIIRHPDVQRMLLHMRARTEAARAIALYAASCLDLAAHHEDPAVRDDNQAIADLLTPVVKAWSTDAGIDAANLCIQVHGGIGYIEESGAPQLLRDVRIAAIYEGTNGIQAQHLVARVIAHDGGRSVDRLLARIRQGLDDIDGDGPPTFTPRLAAAVADLADATRWACETMPQRPEQVAFAAAEYLRLLGTVVGGWLLARGASVARRLLAGNDGDTAFLSAKIASARFFADSHLVQSKPLRDVFIAADGALAGLDRETCV